MPRHKLAFIVTVLSFTSFASAADNFQAWCDTFTAQGMVSLAANRIFGNITAASDADYQRRKEWVNNAYALSDQRYKALTGEAFQSVDLYNKHKDWVSRCQLKDQIR